MTRTHLRPILWLSFALALPACGLLDVQAPDTIDPSGLNTPQGAQAKRIGAIGSFGLAKDGDGSQDTDPNLKVSTEGLILLSGDLSDEFRGRQPRAKR